MWTSGTMTSHILSRKGDEVWNLIYCNSPVTTTTDYVLLISFTVFSVLRIKHPECDYQFHSSYLSFLCFRQGIRRWNVLVAILEYNKILKISSIRNCQEKFHGWKWVRTQSSIECFDFLLDIGVISTLNLIL